MLVPWATENALAGGRQQRVGGGHAGVFGQSPLGELARPRRGLGHPPRVAPEQLQLHRQPGERACPGAQFRHVVAEDVPRRNRVAHPQELGHEMREAAALAQAGAYDDFDNAGYTVFGGSEAEEDDRDGDDDEEDDDEDFGYDDENDEYDDY